MYKFLLILFIIVSIFINILIIYQNNGNILYKNKKLNYSKKNINKIIIFLIALFFFINLIIVNMNISLFKKNILSKTNENIITSNNIIK